MDFVRDYELTGREHRIRVREDSRVVGQTLQQLEARRKKGVNLVAIERWLGRRRELIEPRPDVVLCAGILCTYAGQRTWSLSSTPITTRSSDPGFSSVWRGVPSDHCTCGMTKGGSRVLVSTKTTP
jgi:hypothetical protein